MGWGLPASQDLGGKKIIDGLEGGGGGEGVRLAAHDGGVASGCGACLGLPGGEHQEFGNRLLHQGPEERGVEPGLFEEVVGDATHEVGEIAGEDCGQV